MLAYLTATSWSELCVSQATENSIYSVTRGQHMHPLPAICKGPIIALPLSGGQQRKNCNSFSDAAAWLLSKSRPLAWEVSREDPHAAMTMTSLLYQSRPCGARTPLDIIWSTARMVRFESFCCTHLGLDAKFNRLERWVVNLEPMSLELIRRPGIGLRDEHRVLTDTNVSVDSVLRRY